MHLTSRESSTDSTQPVDGCLFTCSHGTVAAGILVDKQQTPLDDVISYIDVMWTLFCKGRQTRCYKRRCVFKKSSFQHCISSCLASYTNKQWIVYTIYCSCLYRKPDSSWAKSEFHILRRSSAEVGYSYQVGCCDGIRGSGWWWWSVGWILGITSRIRIRGKEETGCAVYV